MASRLLHRSRRPVPLLLLLLLYSSTRRATDDLSRTPKHTRATQQSITNRMPQDNHHGQSHGRTGVTEWAGARSRQCHIAVHVSIHGTCVWTRCQLGVAHNHKPVAHPAARLHRSPATAAIPRRYHSLHTLQAHSRIRRFFRHPEARASCPSFALAAATASQVQAPLREGSSHR